LKEDLEREEVEKKKEAEEKAAKAAIDAQIARDKKAAQATPEALIEQMEKKMKISKKKGGMPPVVKQI